MDFIIQESIRNSSYAARWGQGFDKSELNISVVYKLCIFIPIHDPCDCAGCSVFSRSLSTVDTLVHLSFTAMVHYDSSRGGFAEAFGAHLSEDANRI